MVAALHGRHYVEQTDLKRHPVGMPIQAAAEAMEDILARRRFDAAEVESVVCKLPPHGARIVDSRTMPDINVQYVLAVIMADGGLTFESAHDYARRETPGIADLMTRIRLVPDASLDGEIDGVVSSRRAVVGVTLRDGSHLEQRVMAAKGCRVRPLDWAEVRAKAVRVLAGSCERRAIDALCDAVENLEQVEDVRSLRPLLTPMAGRSPHRTGSTYPHGKPYQGKGVES